MSFRNDAALVIAGMVFSLGCGQEPPFTLSSGQTVPEGLLAAVSAGEARRAVVLLGEPGPMGLATAEALDRGSIEQKVARFAAYSSDVQAVLDPTDLEGAQIFEHLPMMVLEVHDVATFERLASAPNVLAVYEDEVVRPSLTQSLNLIDQPAAYQAGATGAGTSVAVLDTGTDYTRSAFGSCSAPGALGCKVVFAQDFAPDDGVPDANGHGTNVSGIVLGVAPDAKIVDMDVFRSNGLGYSSDIIAAVDWVIANQSTYNIVAMNLSLGGGRYYAECSNSVYAAPLANARAAGVLPVVASGNDGWSDSIAAPACVPAAVSVGAVYAGSYGGFGFSACTDIGVVADQVTCFSNSHEMLTLLAPGALITAAGLTMAGTSQATPHVAGAVAALQSAFPSESLDTTLGRMVSSGVSVTDARNSLVRPRLDLSGAVNATPADTTAPAGTIDIESGAVATKTATVALALTATDNVAVTEVCLSNTSSCSSWLPYAASRSWVLAGGEGTATVYARYRDAAGNESGLVSDTILLDTIAPSSGTLEADSSEGAHTLTWSGITDGGSGIANYVLVHATDASPSTCADGDSVYTGSATSFVHSGRQNGVTDGYRVCAVDAAGNVSSGASTTARLPADVGLPNGTLQINDGSGWVKQQWVQLSLTASDDDGVDAMCLSNSSSCQFWRPFESSRWHRLAGLSGPQTVYVWFRDTLGNVSSVPASATVEVDATPPTDGTVTAIGQGGAIGLSWAGFADAESGLGSYRVVASGWSLVPATCQQGTVVYEGVASSTTLSGLNNNSTYGYRVCASNGLGMWSTGASVSARPVPELDPPTGSVQIGNGSGWVGQQWVQVHLTASDPSGVDAMCLSNSSACSNWRPFESSRWHKLDGASGSQTVKVWFRDIYQNVTASPLAAAVSVDTSEPTDGTVTAAGQGASIVLSWNGFSDAESGVSSYRVLASGWSLIPPTCQQGTVVYEGSDTTTTITGLGNGSTFGYRVCAVNAAGLWSAGATTSGRPVPETDAPTGTLQVENGSGWVKQQWVQVHLTATDSSGVDAMCLSNTPSCSNWRSFETSRWHQLAGVSGSQTVYVWFRDIYQNVSLTPLMVTVEVDSTAPSGGTLTAAGQGRSIDLSWTGFADAESGVSNYRVVASGWSLVPSTCEQGTVVYEGSATAATVTGLDNGSTYGYRVCATNAAGLWSSGASASSRPVPEFDAPSGSFQVEDGSGWVKQQWVQLNLTATDSSGVDAMCLSNTSSCSNWRPFESSRWHKLASVSGPQTVYVWFRDAYQNVTAAPLTATVEVDATAPTDGTVTATGQGGAIGLSWSGFSDAESGLSIYRVVASGWSLVPPSCQQGTVVFEGSGTTTTITGLNDGSTYGYRVCALNTAGVWSAGASASGLPDAP